MLQSMESQRAGHDLVTEQQQDTEILQAMWQKKKKKKTHLKKKCRKSKYTLNDYPQPFSSCKLKNLKNGP